MSRRRAGTPAVLVATGAAMLVAGAAVVAADAADRSSEYGAAFVDAEGRLGDQADDVLSGAEASAHKMVVAAAQSEVSGPPFEVVITDPEGQRVDSVEEAGEYPHIGFFWAAGLPPGAYTWAPQPDGPVWAPRLLALPAAAGAGLVGVGLALGALRWERRGREAAAPDIAASLASPPGPR